MKAAEIIVKIAVTYLNKIMIYKIEWIETKGEGWKVATLHEGIEGGQTHQNVSINKMDKNSGAVAFPTFDAFAPGGTVEGNIWTSQAGKSYLFAPKPSTAAPSASGRPSGGAMTKVMEKKQENISENMDRKEMGIKVSGAMRDATLITTALLEGGHMPADDEEIKGVWRKYRDFFMSEYDGAKDLPF